MLHHKLFVPAGVRHHLVDILHKYVNGSYLKIPQIVYSYGLAEDNPLSGLTWLDPRYHNIKKRINFKNSGNGYKIIKFLSRIYLDSRIDL